MEQPLLNIGIQTEAEIVFLLKGDFICSKGEGFFSGRFKASLSKYLVEVSGSGFELKTKDEIIFSPVDPEDSSFILQSVTIGKNFHWEKKENQKFQGSLKLLKDDDKITAVNVIPLEEYLVSVISSEMSSTSSLELLKAHAIISRSWILAQLNMKKKVQPENSEQSVETENEIIKWYDREDHDKYDFCSDDHCQRYQGVTKVVTENSFSAVEETRGIVLKEGKEICDTRYSKCCGGITETFENVWENVEHKYLKNISDYKFDPEGFKPDLRNEKDAAQWIKEIPSAFCNTQDKEILSQVLTEYDQKTTDFFRWKVIYNQKELAKLINTKSGIDFGGIKDLIPVERGYSGRIIKLKIVGTKKTLTIGKELFIRKVLSKTHLYSSAFIIKKEKIEEGIPQRFILTGAGWGHGVGLCQIGAAVMGEMGYSFDAILIHYFRGAEIKRIY